MTSFRDAQSRKIILTMATVMLAIMVFITAMVFWSRRQFRLEALKAEQTLKEARYHKALAVKPNEVGKSLGSVPADDLDLLKKALTDPAQMDREVPEVQIADSDSAATAIQRDPENTGTTAVEADNVDRPIGTSQVEASRRVYLSHASLRAPEVADFESEMNHRITAAIIRHGAQRSMGTRGGPPNPDFAVDPLHPSSIPNQAVEARTDQQPSKAPVLE